MKLTSRLVKLPVCRPPCKSSVKLRHGCPGHARESVQFTSSRMFYAHGVPLGISSCPRQTRHPFAVSGSEEPPQKIEFVFSASPEQFVESLGRIISFAQSATCRTWQSAHCVHPVYFGSILCCRSPAFFSRHEVSLLPIHGKQICDHLPRYGKCRPIAISFLPFLVINHSHFVVLSRCQLGGFYQRTLDMFIALLRERHTHRLVGRAPFLSAEAAVADGLLDRAEA